MQFLYNMFTNNVDSFERLLQTKKITIETNNSYVSEEDARIINGFLDWDNEEKNIEIFNLACYALEYCLLTANKSAHFSLDSLRNKTFYLDTNILYRAIGINGEDRKKRAHLFLSKFKSLSNEVKLTKGTLEEFENSINGYIKRLRKSETPAIHSTVYSEYVTTDDIWRYYHVWRAHRSNGTVDYFANFLQSEFKNLCEKYSIDVDDDQPFVTNDFEEELRNNASSIKGLSDKKSYETALYDAQNVKWVECKRGRADKSIFDAKYFLLSSDGGLRFWDVRYHSKNAPVVIMPSQWLSIILRYMERTSDDYKSFVCFLNIKSGFDIMTEEQIHYVLQGISEVTTDVEQQRFLLRTIVENDFKNGAKDLNDVQIKQISKNSAERLLQSQLEDANKQKYSSEEAAREVLGELERVRAELSSSRGENELQDKKRATEINRLNSLLRDKETEIEDARSESADKDRKIEVYQRKEFVRKKRRKLIFSGVIIFALLVHIVGVFVVDDDSVSYLGMIVSWLNGLDDIRRGFAVPVFSVLLSAILVPTCIAFYRTAVELFTSKNDGDK